MYNNLLSCITILTNSGKTIVLSWIARCDRCCYRPTQEASPYMIQSFVSLLMSITYALFTHWVSDSLQAKPSQQILSWLIVVLLGCVSIAVSQPSSWKEFCLSSEMLCLTFALKSRETFSPLITCSLDEPSSLHDNISVSAQYMSCLSLPRCVRLSLSPHQRRRSLSVVGGTHSGQSTPHYCPPLMWYAVKNYLLTLWHEVLIWNGDFCLSRWNQEDYW